MALAQVTLHMKHWAVIGVSAALLAGSASTAHAHAGHKLAIPNAVTSNCLTCHLPGAEYLRNEFGLAIEPLALSATPMDQWWPAVRELDSDADGQTNAQELGDPCLTFAMGSMPDRTTNISNPGDVTSLSTDPDSCVDPEVDPGEGEGEPEMPETPEQPVDEGSDGDDTTDPDDSTTWSDPKWQMPAPQQKGCSASSGEDSGSSQIGWWLLAAGLALVTRALRGGDDEDEEEESS